MIGDRIRITYRDGRTLAGAIVETDDATWRSGHDHGQGWHGYLYSITIEHRPQWPSMANRRLFLAGDDDRWYTEDHLPVTLETIEPAAAPQPPRPQLVKR